LELSLNVVHGIHVIHLRGRFAIGRDVDEFRSTVESLRKDGVNRFVLNMSEVPMMDSSAIGTVMRLTASAKKDGGDVKLVSPSNAVIQTMKIVGLLVLFKVYDDENTAANSFDSSNAPPTEPQA